jgi:hypothetical protein
MNAIAIARPEVIFSVAWPISTHNRAQGEPQEAQLRCTTSILYIASSPLIEMAPPPGLRLLLHRPLHCRAPCIQSFRRDISGTAYNRSQAGESSKPEKQAEKVSPRWLSDVKSRIGKCIIFGLKPEQLERAGSILKTVSKEWRSLVAGSEGYLTGPKRGGLEKHSIVWGEQDTMVCHLREPCLNDVLTKPGTCKQCHVRTIRRKREDRMGQKLCPLP